MNYKTKNDNSTGRWNDIDFQNQAHPNYHEFYGYYSDLSRNVAGRTLRIEDGKNQNGGHDFIISLLIYTFCLADASSLRSEPDCLGFPSENSFKTSDVFGTDSETTIEDEVFFEEEPVSRVRKNPFRNRYENYHNRRVKIEKDVTPEPVRFHSQRGNTEIDELFQQLKCLIPDTITITLLQTATALVKAGFTESFLSEVDSSQNIIKEEREDVKPGRSSKFSIRNKRNFFAFGKNKHLSKLKMIKKKGLFRTKNLLKFEINNV